MTLYKVFRHPKLRFFVYFIIEKKDGRFKIGDVLTESYIKKIRFKKNKEKANQYNRRTSFKVLREDYIPVFSKEDSSEDNK